MTVRRNSYARHPPRFEQSMIVAIDDLGNHLHAETVRTYFDRLNAYRDLEVSKLIHRSDSTNPTSISNHTTTADAPQHTPRPAREHLYGPIIKPFTPRPPDSDNSYCSCGLNPSTQHAVSATIATNLNTAWTSPGSFPITT